ncbi:DUF4282 domain-containing protein [Actinomadura verrucosospora]|uniref:DUF4282 domain-containing protein n=1 Tax=Actinomadura verrucosospora TaxID=46165 RepID=A0A7D3VT63_ACTVE|nr:DUF4282 domain-containing protein [Actinomadura verrucosospora]QKG22059.1 hypothetical protein ACTIVE_3697 [Actinomadura verrucosospora]
MTHPSDPGQPPRPPGPPPGPAAGPYGPPPQQPGPGPVPGPRPGGSFGTGPYEQPQSWQPPPRDPNQKGLLGSLLDANFNNLVTPKLIKLFYILSLLLISVQCLIFLGLGLWIAGWDDFWAWGVIMVCASPFVWLFELLLVRIFMEAMVVRFKEVEYLRIIKDKD